MSTISNTVAEEIDNIIAQAMLEYQRAKGIDVFGANDDAPSEESPNEPEESEEPEASVEEVIPANSRSILVDETTSRFSSAIWYDNIQKKTITLAGLGGIGSYVAFLLARMKPYRLIIYDDDIVESANMSGQLYSSSQIGRSKAFGMTEMMAAFSNYYEVISMEERFTNRSQPTDIMICGFDNMEARKTFFDVWEAHLNDENVGSSLFIDGRLAAESFQVLCIKGDDKYSIERYKRDYLFSDDEADETVCSYKQTSFMANMIGSIMVNLFVNFCANECDPLVPRDLPFYTEYTAETMYFKVIA